MNRKEENYFKNFTEFRIYNQDKIKLKGILGFNWSLVFFVSVLPLSLLMYVFKQIINYKILQLLPWFLMVLISVLLFMKHFEREDIIRINYLKYKKSLITHDKCEVSLSGKQKKGMSSMTIKFSDMIHDKGEKVNDNGRGQYQRTRPTRWINGIKQDANTAK